RSERFEFLISASVLDQPGREFPAFGETFHSVRDEQGGGGIEQNSIALGPAFLTAQDAPQNFRVHRAIPAHEIAQRTGLNGKRRGGKRRTMKAALLVKFRN